MGAVGADDLPRESRWFLILTRAQRERETHARLLHEGYGSYFPRLVKRCRRRGKRMRLISPLFPRYLFLRLLVGAQDLHHVKLTRGVLGIVRFGEDYAIVPDGVVARIQARENPQTGLYHWEERRLRPHMGVRVTGGPFEGIEGVFLRDCGADRVLVLMSVMGVSTPVTVSEEWVEPLCAAGKLVESSSIRAA